jgi:hypothetical protein
MKHAQAHNLLDDVYDNMDAGNSNAEEVITDENEGRFKLDHIISLN